MTIGLLISARMGSTRLKDKHLREVAGRPILDYLIDRLEKEFYEELLSEEAKIFIATGSQISNEKLSVFKREHCHIFYGDDNNVPKRHLQLARAHNLNAIVSLDGDDLFVDPIAVRQVFTNLQSDVPLVKTCGLPLGMNVLGYGVCTLSKAISGASPTLLETGWGRIFDGFDCKKIDLECPGADLIRATLDYPEDLEFFSRVITGIPNWAELPVNLLVKNILSHNINSVNGELGDRYWLHFSKKVAEEQIGANEKSYSQRLNHVIPGGAHTYSRGDDQYPSNAPEILERGKGAYVWCPQGKKYLDYGMALRAVSIGYAESKINEAAIRGMELGNSLTRASLVELEAAERLIDLIDSVEMVKFTKNGSTATSAAVKLARAYTGRTLVARCAQHPFFSFDDWFIGSTPITKGIPAETIQQTKQFSYNDINSLNELISQYPEQIACVILEPIATEEPAVAIENGIEMNYLQQVQEVCAKNGIVFILDETITGFRWSMKGAQHIYNVKPDLSTFGKAMANGFSVAAVGGRREIMELGGINCLGQERLFLLSTTHGAEMSGLSAFIATAKFLEDHQVIPHLWKYGSELIAMINRLARQYEIAEYIYAGGPAANPFYLTLNEYKTASLPLRTLFSQEMINQSVLIPWLAFSYRHGDVELRQTEQALHHAFAVCKKAIQNQNIMASVQDGKVIKPVFRVFN